MAHQPRGPRVSTAADDLAFAGAARRGRADSREANLPVELVTTYLDRIGRLDGHLRAFITVCSERPCARSRAGPGRSGPGSMARPASRRAVRGEGSARHCGHCHHVGLGPPQAECPLGRLDGGGEAQGGGRDSPRQAQPDRSSPWAAPSASRMDSRAIPGIRSTTQAARPPDRVSPPRPPSARSPSARTRAARCGAPLPTVERSGSGRRGDASRVTAAFPPRGPWTRWARSPAPWKTAPSCSRSSRATTRRIRRAAAAPFRTTVPPSPPGSRACGSGSSPSW